MGPLHRLLLVAALVAALPTWGVRAQANGNLQLHFMDVGQGDGALVITPGGERVLIDDGALNGCGKPLGYLQRLGVTAVDYHVASHYHADHIGCAQELLGFAPLQAWAFDRGGAYSSQTYQRYVTAVGGRRASAPIGNTLTLDGGAVAIDFLGANGSGTPGASDENDLGVVVRLRYRGFKAVFGGDIGGSNDGGYADVESRLAPVVGPIDLLKVNHHGSRYSTNGVWLGYTRPRAAVISVGNANSYGHPSADALARLRFAGVKSFWTSVGNGAPPDPAWDAVGGNIVVQVPPTGTTFAVSTDAGGAAASFPIWEQSVVVPGAPGTPTATVTGATVQLQWTAPTAGGAPDAYVLEAALAPGGPAIAVVETVPAALTAPGVPPVTYNVRVRARNAAGIGPFSIEVPVVVGGAGCATAPDQPGTLTGSVAGTLVTFGWTAPAGGCAPTGYRLLAGTAPGAANIAALDLAATALQANAPPGTYYVRVQAVNTFGASSPSNEVVVTVGPSCVVPAAPTLAVQVTGQLVAFTWQPGGSGLATPTDYILDAGSGPGLSNIASVPLAAAAFSATAPPGSYFVRVRGRNACGIGASSNEVVATVACATPGAPLLSAPSVSGSTVGLSWTPPASSTPITGYRVEAGSAPGLSNLLSTTTALPTYTWGGAPVGTAYLRVTALSNCGAGSASNTVSAVITTTGGGGGGLTCSGASVPSSVSCGTPTARCNNGQYSCSQNRSGTCSSNGGVSCWVCPGPLCSPDLLGAAFQANPLDCADGAGGDLAGWILPEKR